MAGSYIEILTSHAIVPEIWVAQLQEEYLGQVFWSPMMGTSDSMPIQLSYDLTKKKGDSINVPIRSQLQGGHVTGNSKGIGNEGKLDFYNFAFTIDNDRQVVAANDLPMSEQRASFSILTAARNALVDAAKFQLEDDLTTAMTVTTTGRVRGRYLYGATDGNWNATHSTALTNVDNTDDKLTVPILGIAKRKAKKAGGANNPYAKIRPAKVKVSANQWEEWYYFVTHDLSTRDLTTSDASWKNAELNLPPMPGRDSSIFTGSNFKGAREGILVYEWDRMPLVSSTIQVSHGLLCGAQACMLGWGQMSKFGEEYSDLGHAVSYEVHEIRGTKKVVFDRNTVDSTISNEDQGIVHVFTAAVAD